MSKNLKLESAYWEREKQCAVSSIRLDLKMALAALERFDENPDADMLDMIERTTERIARRRKELRQWLTVAPLM